MGVGARPTCAPGIMGGRLTGVGERFTRVGGVGERFRPACIMFSMKATGLGDLAAGVFGLAAAPPRRNQGACSASSALGRACWLTSSILLQSCSTDTEKLARRMRPPSRPPDTGVPVTIASTARLPELSANGCWPPCISMLRITPTDQMSQGRL